MNNSKTVYTKFTSLLLMTMLILASTGCGPTAANPTMIPSATAALNLAPSLLPPTETLIPTETAIPTNTPVPTNTATPMATSTPFVPKATIRIAVQSPLTGQFANIGINILQGAKLAAGQLYHPLMEMGIKVELVSYDDESDSGVAIETAKQIVADPEILCLVGPALSRDVNQLKEIYHQAELGFITPSATAAYATASGYLEVNRMVGRHDSMGVAGAQFAAAQGFSRVYVISQNADMPEFVSNYFVNEASRVGIKVVGNTTTDKTSNFDQLITSTLKSETDLVYFSSNDINQAGTFFREARASGYMGAFLGTDAIGSPSLVDSAGPLVVSGKGLYYTSMSPAAVYYPAAKQFIVDFVGQYAAEPGIFAAQAYDAAGICLKAIETTAQGGVVPSRQQVATAIRALKNYPGITGKYTFSENGDPNPGRYYNIQVISANPDDWGQNPLISTIEIAAP